MFSTPLMRPKVLMLGSRSIPSGRHPCRHVFFYTKNIGQILSLKKSCLTLSFFTTDNSSWCDSTSSMCSISFFGFLTKLFMNSSSVSNFLWSHNPFEICLFSTPRRFFSLLNLVTTRTFGTVLTFGPVLSLEPVLSLAFFGGDTCEWKTTLDRTPGFDDWLISKS